MLYSSCFPTRSLHQALENFEALPINAESRKLLLGDNARRVLRLGDGA
jgi:predicted TIM-barrel fold metal-dependent hydrolase